VTDPLVTAARTIAPDPSKALALMLACWREAPDARLAELVEQLGDTLEPPDARALRDERKVPQKTWDAMAKTEGTLGVLCAIANATVQKEILGRVKHLCSRPADPRVSGAFLGWLQDLPFRALSSRPIWDEVFAYLESNPDTRTPGVLASLKADELPCGKTMQRWFAGRLEELRATVGERDDAEHDLAPLEEALYARYPELAPPPPVELGGPVDCLPPALPAKVSRVRRLAPGPVRRLVCSGSRILTLLVAPKTYRQTANVLCVVDRDDGVLLTRHVEGPTAIGGEGSLLAVAEGGTVHVHDLDSGEERSFALFDEIDGALRALALSSDGRWLAAWGRVEHDAAQYRWTCALRLLDLSKPKPKPRAVLERGGPQQAHTALGFGHDDTRLVLRHAAELFVLKMPGAEVVQVVTATPTGTPTQFLVDANRDETRISDLDHAYPAARYPGYLHIKDARATDDAAEALFTVSNQDRALRRSPSTDTPAEAPKVWTPKDQLAACFDPLTPGGVLCSTGAGELWQHAGETKKTDAKKLAFASLPSVKGIALGPGGKVAWWAGLLLHVEDRVGKRVRRVTGKGGAGMARFAGDAIFLAETTSMRRYPLPKGKPSGVYKGHAYPIRVIAVSAEGVAATGAEDNVVIVWDADGTERHRLAHHGAPIRALCFHPDARLLVSCDDDGELCSWDSERGELVEERTIPAEGIGPCFLANGSLAYASDRTLFVDDASTPLDAGVVALAPHPTRPAIALALSDGRVVLRTSNGEEALLSEGHAHMSMLAWDPDGTTLAIPDGAGRGGFTLVTLGGAS